MDIYIYAGSWVPCNLKITKPLILGSLVPLKLSSLLNHLYTQVTRMLSDLCTHGDDDSPSSSPRSPSSVECKAHGP